MIVPVWILLFGVILGVAVAGVVGWLNNRTPASERAPSSAWGQGYTVGKTSSSFSWSRLKDYKLKGAVWTLCGIVALASVFAGAFWGDAYADERWETCNIVSKDYAAGNNYRVNTSCGVFENHNAWIRGKSNAPEMQMHLRIGCTYPLRVAGAQTSRRRANVLEVGDLITCKITSK